MKFAALILAGGASRRMGRAKALLPYEGETFLDHLVGLFGGICGDVTVVLGHQHEQIRAGLKRHAHFALNPDPERGQLSSMQCGLQVLGDCDGFFFTPVDYPAISADTIRSLVEAFEENCDALVVVPQFNGKHGHPVLCRAALRDEFLALPAEGQARDVVKRHTARTLYVDVADRGAIMDVDDPQAYERLVTGIQAV